ncbi:MAG: hypothetical protein HC904_08235 [Blastochloris sp.]|nr:hypothetical protein [Blastochloris sp.]
MREVARNAESVSYQLQHQGGQDQLRFAATSPHRLLEWKRAEGSSLRLKKSLMLDYWNHHDDGDEKLLK